MDIATWVREFSQKSFNLKVNFGFKNAEQLVEMECVRKALARDAAQCSG